jgi:hypothetical protein
MFENFIADGFRAMAESSNQKTMENAAKEGAVTEEGFAVAGYPVAWMNESALSMIGRLVAVVLAFLLIFMFGQYFWNNHVTRLLSIAKKTDSVMDIIGLFLFVRLVLP